MSSQYTEVRLLGFGAFGNVYLVKDREGASFALKKIQLGNRKSETSAMKELDAFGKMSHHDHIVKFHDGFLEARHICIVMDYCSGGDLEEYLLNRPCDRYVNSQFMMQIADAVNFLHENNIVHRDLKPDNVLVCRVDGLNDVIKVTDFGISKIANIDRRVNLANTKSDDNFLKCTTNLQLYASYGAGTEAFIAPEVYEKHYTSKVDIFSLAVIYLAMLEREVDPFASQCNELVALFYYCPFSMRSYDSDAPYIGRIMYQNPNAVRALDYRVAVSPAVRNLINRMMVRDYHRRPTADQVFQTVKEYFVSFKSNQTEAKSSVERHDPISANLITPNLVEVNSKQGCEAEKKRKGPQSPDGPDYKDVVTVKAKMKPLNKTTSKLNPVVISQPRQDDSALCECILLYHVGNTLEDVTSWLRVFNITMVGSTDEDVLTCDLDVLTRDLDVLTHYLDVLTLASDDESLALDVKFTILAKYFHPVISNFFPVLVCY
ncbi:serine/threonine-protein kinase PDIK1L-like [Glandiceps talaboti]